MAFEKGNKFGKGRPKKPEIEELRNALNEVKRKKNKSFLLHFVERAYENDNVAIALAKKIAPDLTESKMDIAGFADIIRKAAENCRRKN